MTTRSTVEGIDAFVVDSVVLGEAAVPAAVGDVASTMESPTQLRIDARRCRARTSSPENANRGWAADAGSEPSVYDGWRQGWQLDDADTEVLAAHFAPDRVYRAGLLVGAVALLLLLLMVVRPEAYDASRRRRSRSRRASPLVVAVLAVASGALLAGPAGTAVAAAAVLVGGPGAAARAGHRLDVARRSRCSLPAAAAYVVRPWGDSDGWAGIWRWPHYLVLAACAAALGALAADSSRRQRSDTRADGTSITR